MREVHRHLHATIHFIRSDLQGTLEKRMKELNADCTVRVSFSLLSSDESTVRYIAWAPGSLTRSFSKKSIAWVATYARLPRWWKRSLWKKSFAATDDSAHGEDQPPKDEGASKRALLFDNRPRQGKEPLPVKDEMLWLDEYYQYREGYYKAFIVLPAPWGRRDMPGGRRRGGIHISFSKEEGFDKIFDQAERHLRSEKVSEKDTKNQPLEYERIENVEDLIGDERIAQVITSAIETYGRLLQGFNERVFEADARSSLDG